LKTFSDLKALVPFILWLLICLTANGFQQPGPNLDKYIRLNNQEKRLADFKDSRKMLIAKLEHLKVINQSRAKFGAPPVQLDILASRVANKQSKEAAEKNFRGHWNLRGEKPYHRYAFAGGKDNISENASASWKSGGAYKQSIATQSRLMHQAHNRFMAEKAPNDGHKKTIIDPVHNYVGIGSYITSTQFRYYELFLNRYLNFIEVPLHVTPGDSTVISVKPLHKDHYIVSLIAYFEPFLRSMKRKKVNKMGSYADYTSKKAFTISPWQMVEYRKKYSYNIPVSFSRKGLYYIKIYLDDKNPAGYSSFTTQGKISGSGLIIEVQ